MKTFEELVKSRKEFNHLLIQLVSNYLTQHPQIRFNQALYNLSIINETDTYYEEPELTWERIHKIETETN